MDIYILRDGKEIGPFSEETTQTLLRQGSVREVDFAWHPGLPKWIPLTDVLNPAAPALETPPPPPPNATAEIPPLVAAPAGDLPKAGESATEKQKALLSYLGIPFSADLSKDKAALLVNDAMEDAKNAARLAQWNSDRLKLHPDLFEAEIKAKKESRVGGFFGLCETEGAEYFTKITKAHCQVLVGFLDVKFPDWDEDKEAARKYFFPAVAEKFPQLVAKPWQGKLRYATASKTAAEPSRQRPARGRPRRRPSWPALPMATMARGLVFAVLIVAMCWFVRGMMNASGSKSPAPTGKAPGGQAENPAPKPAAEPSDALPAAGPDKAIAPADPANPAAAPALPGDAPVADPAIPGAVDPKMAAAPGDPKMVATPANPEMVADPLAPKPAVPAAGSPPDPLAPVNPAPAPVPAPAPATPAVDPAAPAVDPATPPKANLKLTKPVDVQLAYGKMKLPVGTPVKFVAREGNAVRVNYLNTVLLVPIASTDFADPAPVPVLKPAGDL